MTIPIVFVGFF